MPRHTEPGANYALCAALSETLPVFGVRSENTRQAVGSPNLRPDILIVADGRSPVAVKAEFMPARAAESEARERLGLEVGGAAGRRIDSAVALRCPDDVGDAPDFADAIRRAALSYAVLYADGSRFPQSGWLEGGVGELSDLEHLHLPDNALTGDIPPALGNLSNLRSLALDANLLTGGIPPALGDLSDLESLHLSNNALTGDIPPALGDLRYLESLRLSDNALTGGIPSALGNPRWLNYLRLSENALSGCVPASLSGVADSDLGQLGLPFCAAPAPEPEPSAGGANWASGDNWLSDRPLNEWHGVETDARGRVTALRLPRNNLSGEPPAALGELPNLRVLELQGNSLSGAIPPELGGAAYLRYLNLADNNLSGAIPDALGGLARLNHLDLSRNGLSGEIPPALGELSRIKNLDLSHNSLSGGLPDALGGLTSLTDLHLGGNALTGCVPRALSALPYSDLPSLALRTCGD